MCRFFVLRMEMVEHRNQFRRFGALFDPNVLPDGSETGHHYLLLLPAPEILP